MTLTATVEISCSLTNPQVEQIMDSAAIGIHYWASEAEIIDLSLEGDTTGGCILSVIPQEDTQVYRVDKAALENAIYQAISRPELPGLSGAARGDLLSCLLASEPEEIDPGTANELVQIACFSEVIYG
jgi:hypothetical protein